jgi:tetratricopeptide (TPR) repeat protein
MVDDTWTDAMKLECAGQHRRAYERFRLCLEIPGLDRADVHFHMGWCLEAGRGDGESALAHYLQAAALALDPPLAANANYRAGLLAFDSGDLQRAILLLEKAREVAAPQPFLQDLTRHAAYWLGICCEADGRIMEATELYDTVTQSTEPRLRAEARYRQVLSLASIGAFEAALGVARDLIECDYGGDERIAQLADLAAQERDQILRALGDA